MKKNQHVVPHAEGWAVKGEGNNRATRVFPKQTEAIEFGRTIAQNQKAQLKVHSADGKIRTEYTYGKDPFPPRG